MLKYIPVISLALSATVLNAADDPWTVNFHLENDLFANTDLNYTNGIRASWISPDLTDYVSANEKTYPWLSSVNDLLEPLHPNISYSENVQRNIVFSVGQLIFTPEDRERTTIDGDDRPYAGWLYGGIGYQARTSDKLHSFEFNLGMVGPASLAEESQNLVHDFRGIERFEGWDNQLNNELGIQMVFERKRRFKPFSGKIANNISTDIITHWGGSLGNVATYVNAGAQWRIGWNLPNDFGVSTLRPGGDGNNPGIGDPKHRAFQIHAFVAGDARYVGHNIFLDGNTFSSSHSVAKKHVVADIIVGVSTSYQSWNVGYSQVYRTKEFKTQDQAQEYGSLFVSYSY